MQIDVFQSECVHSKKGFRWTLGVFQFQFSIPDHLKLLVGFLDPLFLAADGLPDGGSHLLTGAFFLCCFHISFKFKKFICDICRMQSYEDSLKRQNVFWIFYQKGPRLFEFQAQLFETKNGRNSVGLVRKPMLNAV